MVSVTVHKWDRRKSTHVDVGVQRVKTSRQTERQVDFAEQKSWKFQNDRQRQMKNKINEIDDIIVSTLDNVSDQTRAK